MNEKRNEKMLKSELGSQLMSEKEMDTYLKKYEGEKILIKGDYRKIETNKHIKKKEELIYLQDILKMQVKNSQDKIDSLREKISIQEDVKKTLNTEIQSLKNEKKYQTKEEIRETERNVLNRESEIEDANKIQKEIADHIKLEQDKIKKRNEQLKDIEEKSQGISKK